MILPNFVTFEGTDGTGTTSQIRLLKERFTIEGKAEAAVFTQEPTSNEIGKLIRAILQGSLQFTPETTARLFAADRHEHLYGKNGIIEQLNSKKAVFSDRYIFSSLAYQSASGVREIAVKQNEDFPLPEYLFFFDLSVDISMERIFERSNILELYEEKDFQKKVRSEYLQLLKQYREIEPKMNIIIIDASKSIEEIHSALWSTLQYLPKIE